MQIYLDEKIIFIHSCIHMNSMTYELANNLLLIIAIIILLQCQGSEGITSPDYPLSIWALGLHPPCLQSRIQFRLPGISLILPTAQGLNRKLLVTG